MCGAGRAIEPLAFGPAVIARERHAIETIRHADEVRVCAHGEHRTRVPRRVDEDERFLGLQIVFNQRLTLEGAQATCGCVGCTSLLEYDVGVKSLTTGLGRVWPGIGADLFENDNCREWLNIEKRPFSELPLVLCRQNRWTTCCGT
jgi:hypothetical protein